MVYLRNGRLYIRYIMICILFTSISLLYISFIQIFLKKEKKNLEMLSPYGINPDTHKDNDEYVLVLGANGLIGSVLCERLEKKGYKVLKVLSRHHRDLRIEKSLDIFNKVNIKFVYFLAYEVGGAKFLQLSQHQKMIKESNIKMMSVVFDWILNRRIRFAFASSSLSADNSTYGYVKRIGENFIR